MYDGSLITFTNKFPLLALLMDAVKLFLLISEINKYKTGSYYYLQFCNVAIASLGLH